MLVRQVEQIDILPHQLARARLSTLFEYQLDALGARAVQAELGGHVKAGELDLVVEVGRHLVTVRIGVGVGFGVGVGVGVEVGVGVGVGVGIGIAVGIVPLAP